MANMTPGRLRWERINPCLLDKLSDEEGLFPNGAAVMSRKQYEESVVRDLKELLNTKTHVPGRRVASGVPDNLRHIARAADTQPTLAQFPEAARSVLTYGVPDMRGRTMDDAEADQLEVTIREVIRFFEPRIDSDTVRVERVTTEERAATGDAVAVLRYRVTGLLWAFPKPERLDLNTLINVNTGEVDVFR